MSAAPGDRLNGMARSAVWVAGISAVTLVLTLTWQLLIARMFGASTELDAFWIAFSIPRAIAESFHLGLLTLLFVLVFKHENDAQDVPGADRWRQSSAVLNATLAFTAVGMVVLFAAAPILVRAMAPGLPPGDQVLSASLLRWLTLYLIPTAIAAAIGGVAIAHDNLIPFTLSRAAVPALQMATLAVLVGVFGVRSLVWALWIGAAGALLVYLPWLRRVGFEYSLGFGLHDPKTRRIMQLQAVLAFIWLLITLNQVADRYFASLLGAGSVSALEFAWRFEIPIAQVVSLGVALPTFARLAQSATRDRGAEFRATLANSARLLTLAVTPLLGFMVVLREPLVRLWLERGAFSAESVHAVASLLPALAPVYFCRAFASILVFGLLTVGRTRMLVIGLTIEVVLNAILDAVLSRAIGLPGIALASAGSMLLVNGALWIVLLRHVGGVRFGPMFAELRPVAIASVVAAGTLDLAWRAIQAYAPLPAGSGALIPLGVIAGVYGVVYVAVCIGTGVITLHGGKALPQLALRSLE